MEYPEGLLYSREHEWIKIENTMAVIGITAFAQDQLGDIVFVDIKENRKPIAAGEVFGSIEAVKTVSDLFMPIGGTILEVNPRLQDTPELVNNDPYGYGWLVKVQLSENASAKDLLSAWEYRRFVG